MSIDPNSFASRQWYYSKGSQQFGPVPFSHLQSGLSSGQILREDLVWCEGMPTWQRAGEVPGLLPGVRAAAAHRPPDMPPLPGARPAAASPAPLPADAHSRAPGYAVLALTIFGSFLSIGIGGCTSSITSRVAAVGDSVNEVQAAASQAAGVAGARNVDTLRVDTDSVRSFGAKNFFYGVLEALLAVTGGVVAFRYFGTVKSLRLGDFDIGIVRACGVSILLAAMLTSINIFTFWTAGILFGIAAAICLFAPQPVAGQAAGIR